MSAESCDFTCLRTKIYACVFIIKRLGNHLEVFLPLHWVVPVDFWIYELPKSKKDYTVNMFCEGMLYIKCLNKWWDGYEGEESILMWY